VRSFQWPDHELIWWTKWHEYFFIMSVINQHQNDQWLQCHSVSCAQLLNVGLHTEVYLYDIKMCDRDYRYVMNSIFRHSRLSDILSCDKPCRINGFWLYLYTEKNHLAKMARLWYTLCFGSRLIIDLVS